MIDGMLQPLHLLFFLLLLAFGLLTVVAWWRILAKTGNPGPLGLLMWVPVLNVALLFWLAFSQWPIERRAGPLEKPKFCPNCGTAVIPS
jgi:hypothetical protein